MKIEHIANAIRQNTEVCTRGRVRSRVVPLARLREHVVQSKHPNVDASPGARNALPCLACIFKGLVD